MPMSKLFLQKSIFKVNNSNNIILYQYFYVELLNKWEDDKEESIDKSMQKSLIKQEELNLKQGI